MTNDFDPSPRASKRRRISTNAETRSVQKETAEVSKPSRRSGATGKQVHAPLKEQQNPENTDGAEEEIYPRSSGRERKKPHRYLASPEPVRSKTTAKNLKASGNDGNTQKPKKTTLTPKSILSPLKKSNRNVRKSVAFDSSREAIEVQLGFKDIDVPGKKSEQSVTTTAETPTKQRGKPSKKPAAEASAQFEDGDDDLVFDQILEVQRWDTDTIRTKDSLSALSLDTDSSMLKIKDEILSRFVTSSHHSDFMIPAHLQSQFESIRSLLTATITTGESNSLLVLGSRGSGKTYILNIALQEMKNKYADDFHLVQLNGFFQTDDKLALREIWRQLGHEMNIDDSQNENTGSYADTMASLLSLLSHPDEYLDPSSDLLHLDKGPSTTLSKSIVFVLDEFDLFTTHPRQTLLYNLFDIAQSRKAPIAVIGCSTRMDVVECLEKRVKSRFSHRWVHIPNAKSLEGFQDIVRQALNVNEVLDRNGKRLAPKDIEARKRWNQYIQRNFLHSAWLQHSIMRIFYTTKSVPDLFTAMYLTVARLQMPAEGESSNGFDGDAFVSAPPQLNDILMSLPILHLSLLVAASRLDTIHNLAALNFNLVYNHYMELIARTKLRQTASGAMAVGAGLRQWALDMAGEAWEDLGEWGLIVPASGSSGLAGRDVAVANIAGGEGASVRMWKVDLTLDDLVWALRKRIETGGTAAGAVEMIDKWCREI